MLQRLYYAVFGYMVLGLAAGLFYRELTKANDFAGGFTQLSVVHTHLLTLGFIVLLIALVLEKSFTLSRSRMFGWFFWAYNLGLILTAGTLTWHGTLTVLGQEAGAMISGIAGLGHILLTAGLVLLMLSLGKAIRAGDHQRVQNAP